MHVRLDIADTVIQHNQEKAKTSLDHSVLGNMPCLTLLEDFVNTG
jgi:hypothetical protein